MVVLLCSSCSSNKEYPSGRDTVESYGNGAYQVLKNSYSLSFVNQRYESCLMDNVKAYEKKSNFLYVFGTHYDVPAWIKTDIKTEQSEYYILKAGVTIDDLYIYNKNTMIESGNLVINVSNEILSEQDKEILEEMKKTESKE